MKLLVLYYDGNAHKAKLVHDSQSVSDLREDPPEPFDPSEFGLDEDCDVNYVVELSDDVSPTIYGEDGREMGQEHSSSSLAD